MENPEEEGQKDFQEVSRERERDVTSWAQGARQSMGSMGRNGQRADNKSLSQNRPAKVVQKNNGETSYRSGPNSGSGGGIRTNRESSKVMVQRVFESNGAASTSP